MRPRPPRSTLFPYTTLFRSRLRHVYEVRPRKDKRGVNLISDELPFGRLWYGEPNAIANAIGDRKSTRLNSSHQIISYAVFCLKKKIKQNTHCDDPLSRLTKT